MSDPSGGPADHSGVDTAKRFGWSIFAVFALVVFDQTTKIWTEAFMGYHERIDIVPGFALFRTHNPGIAFSMFAGAGPEILVLLTSAISAFVLYLLWRTPSDQVFARLGFVLILAGAIGNLIDRSTLGHVVDMLTIILGDWTPFGVFNVADVFITFGALLALWQEIANWRAAKRHGS